MAILTLDGRLQKNIDDQDEVLMYHVSGATDVDIVADVLIADGALTVAAQPSFPAKLVFTVTDGDSGITALDATVVGLDGSGASVTETVSLDNSGSGGTITVVTTGIFAALDSITLANAAGNGAGDNVKVGTALAANQDFEVPRFGIWNGATVAAEDWIRRGNVREVVMAAYTDEDADNDGVLIEESMDGTSVHKSSIIVATGTDADDQEVSDVVELSHRYWRFRWQNGTTNQGEFNCDVIARR